MKIYKKILESQEKGNPVVLVTITEKIGHGPRDLGTKMLVTQTGEIIGTIGGGSIEKIAITKAKNCFNNHKNFSEKYILDDNEQIVNSIPTGMQCGGTFTLLYEYVSTNPHIFIFGAGHVGQAINYFLKRMEFNPTFIDNRKSVLEKISDAKTYLSVDFLDFFSNREIPENSFAIIASYSHEIDFKILKKIVSIHNKFQYIGAIASKVKAKSFLTDLKKEFTNKQLKNLFMPIGLKIGGRSPESIALSIVSEIQAIKHNKKEIKNFKLKELI